MDSMGSDFSNSGSVMTKTELEEVRKKRGECVTCGQKCFKKKLFKMIPMDVEGKVLNGRCLNCLPLLPKDIHHSTLSPQSSLVSLLRDGSSSTIGQGSVMTAPVSRVSASRADLERFSRTRMNLQHRSMRNMPTSTQSMNVPPTSTPLSYQGKGPSRSSGTRHTNSFISTTSSGLGIPPIRRRSERSLGSHVSAESTSVASSGNQGSNPRSATSNTNSRSPRRSYSSPVKHVARAQQQVSPAPPSISFGIPLPCSGSTSSPHTLSGKSLSNQSTSSGTSSRGRQSALTTLSSKFDENNNAQTLEMNQSSAVDESFYKTPTDEDKSPTVTETTKGSSYPSISSTPQETAISTNNNQVAGSNARYPEQEIHFCADPSVSQNDGKFPPDVVIHTGKMIQGSGGDNANTNSNNYMGRMESEVTLDMATIGSITEENSTTVPRMDDVGDNFKPPTHGLLNRGGAFVPSMNVGRSNSSRWSNGLGQTRDRPFGTHFIGGSTRTLSSMSSFEEDFQPHQLPRGKMADLDETSESNFSAPVSAGGSLTRALLPGISPLRGTQAMVQPGNARWNASYSDIENVNSSAALPKQQIQRVSKDYEKLVVTLKDSLELPDALKEGLMDLAKTEFQPQDYDSMGELDAPAAIVNAMAIHEHVCDVQRWGCGAIWNVSRTVGNQVAFTSAGGVNVTLKAMQMFPDHQQLQENAIAALSNLAVQADNSIVLAENGAAIHIVKAMSNHSVALGIQIKGCNAISNLASHETTSKHQLIESGAGEAIVGSMVMHKDNAPLQENALKALRILCANCEENQIQISDLGGIDAVICSMQVHRDEPEVQEEAAWTISVLAGNDENKAVIGSSGGIDVIIRAMWVHSDSAGLQEWSVRALYMLTLDVHNADLALQVGAIDAILNALQGHNDRSNLQAMGCAVFANLAETNNEAKMRIVDEEALDAIILAMVLHSEDVQVQEHACKALLNLSIMENLRSMLAANVPELVKLASEKYPMKCGEVAQEIFHAFDQAARTRN